MREHPFSSLQCQGLLRILVETFNDIFFKRFEKLRIKIHGTKVFKHMNDGGAGVDPILTDLMPAPNAKEVESCDG